MQHQAYAFLIFVLNGLLIGIIFDVFRIFRKSFKTPDFVTYIQDFIFWLLSGLLLLYSIFKFNNGELRLFVFLGVTIGFAIYMLAFSRLLINISVSVIDVIKRIFHYLIIVPIKFIIKIFKLIIGKPIIYMCKKIENLCKKIITKSKNILFKRKNYKNKKDFA